MRGFSYFKRREAHYRELELWLPGFLSALGLFYLSSLGFSSPFNFSEPIVEGAFIGGNQTLGGPKRDEGDRRRGTSLCFCHRRDNGGLHRMSPRLPS